MFKSLLLSATLLGSLAASANTVEVAVDLYTKRLEDAANAEKAAKIYEDLAAAEENIVKKAELLVKQSEALYYFGTQQKSDSAKLRIFDAGQKVGLEASKLVRGDEASKTLRARALYFYGSNIGKWGLAKGGTEPLKLFKKVLKPNMAKLIELDETVEEYGVYRILGLGYVKVPGFLGGDKKLGLKMIQKGFDATITEVEDVDYEISTNSTTTRYLLFALMKNKKEEQFCDLANEFYGFAEDERDIQDKNNTYLIPETQEEVRDFLSPKDDSDQEDIEKYYNKKC